MITINVMTDKMRSTLYNRRWMERNPEKAHENVRRWRKNNPESVRENVRRWYKNNIEKSREKSALWAKNNPGKKREIAQRWYKSNREKTLDKSALWMKNNPDKRRDVVRRWASNNPEKAREINHRRRARKRSTEGAFTGEQFKALCSHFDNRCLKCGRPRKMTADHVIPLAWADRFPDDALNDVDNIQPLCVSCNSSKCAKHVDYRTKPHQHCIAPPIFEDYLA